MQVFDINEIFKFAIQIEENGEQFYHYAASITDDEKARDLFIFLAEEEVKHKKIFNDLLSELVSYSAKETYPGEYVEYLQNYVEDIVFTREGLEEELSKINDTLSAINFAIQKELDTIFRERKIFGRLAGESPYPKELIVFKVTLENKTESKILINPEEFVILDDLGTQYQYINPDRIKEIYESESFLYSFTKNVPSCGRCDSIFYNV